MGPNARQIDEPCDLAQYAIARDVAFQTEAVKQRLLHHGPLAHHRLSPRFIGKIESGPSQPGKRVFNTIGRTRSYMLPWSLTPPRDEATLATASTKEWSRGASAARPISDV